MKPFRFKRQSHIELARPCAIGGTSTVGPEATREPCASGDALLADGCAEAALEAYQAAIEIPDTCVAGHVGQAKAYIALGMTEDALDSLEVAMALDASALEAFVVAARLRRTAGETTAAIELSSRAIALAPRRLDLRMELALALNAAGRISEAMQTYRTAIEMDPEAPGPRVNLGLIYLQQLGDPVSAEACFRDTLATSPQFLPAVANLGLALHDQGRYLEAGEVYRRGLDGYPQNVELRWNRAIGRLALADFERGWDDYELRFVRPGGRDLSRIDIPDWDGTRLSGRLLVLAEQGIGDEVMFASCIPELHALADAVTFECAPRLASLFARSFDDVSVRGVERADGMEWLDDYPDLSAKIATGSLPRLLRRNRSSFPHHCGYLRADPSKVDMYRKRLGEVKPGMTIGWSWRAGTPKTRGMLRSVPFEDLRPLLNLHNARFVCLQHGLNDEELRAVRAAGMLVWDDVLHDLDEMAALICALDLVVSAANTVAHLCGALGRPGWVLLNASPEWRWGCSGENSPWYPSLQLLRCARHGGWATVLAPARRMLTERSMQIATQATPA